MDKLVLSFETASDFELWLEEHHNQTTAVWLVLAKKGSGLASPTYAQALDVALCYGWIDGQKASRDESTWLQSFSRRKPRSLWSQVNREHVDRLRHEGRLRAAGERAIDEAKRNGQWDAAYQRGSSRDVPPELEAALAGSPAARAFFETLSSQNRFAFVFRIQTAKKLETKQKRAAEFVRMLENREVFHPQVKEARSIP